jgi:hypothetical protein
MMGKFDDTARELFGVSEQEAKDSMTWAIIRGGKTNLNTEDMLPREVDGKLGLCILFTDGTWLQVKVMSTEELKRAIRDEVISSIIGEAVVTKAAAGSMPRAD